MTGAGSAQTLTGSGWKLPAGTCDCHAHVFGPADQFPVVHEMHYALPSAPAAAHREMLDRTGIQWGVLVQPGAYGSDPAAIVHALQVSTGRLRGIAAAPATISDRDLDAWHEAGIRGLRFNDMMVAGTGARFPGSIPAEQLASLAPRMKCRNWHAEVWASIDRHVELLPLYRTSGIAVVLDHMAGLKPSRGIADAAFRAVLDALREGWLWVKLVLCRCSEQFPDYADLKPFHEALVTANPNRLVWGSDWPHLRLGERAPEVGHLLDLFRGWVPDGAARHRILVDNPAELYRF
ncbi:amidohydrolase family protein [Bradyrhizobium sp. CW7]|uniref:amidohydrolase family protein n=1 Tax=Bradyrhizobium sp. CW7 TaxID=2782688 RepID=UPI0021120A75|nr:amidohydrolase family protein [Bradyrhizobium sp. CW7]MCK1356235.1 amidohydrolase family protein [Bradyrhizobium sp. CW7]